MIEYNEQQFRWMVETLLRTRPELDVDAVIEAATKAATIGRPIPNTCEFDNIPAAKDCRYLRRIRWTPEQSEYLAKAFVEGVPVRDIMKTLEDMGLAEVTQTNVYNRATYLRLRRPWGKSTRL